MLNRRKAKTRPNNTKRSYPYATQIYTIILDRKTNTTFASFMKKFTTIALSTLIFLGLASCSEYQKVLNGEDFDKKLELANELYEKEQYSRALPLYEELKRVFLGQEKMKKVLINLAYCEFNLEQYSLASFHFMQFYEAYPMAKASEDALFQHCLCLYKLSPKETLDQRSTQKAISSFERFTQTYPLSPKVDDCNEWIDALRTKLEFKAFNAARLYHQILDYKAAVWALNNFLQDYPASQYEEDARFLILESSYKFAKASVNNKKEERFVETIEYYKTFKSMFPNSKHSKDAKEYLVNSKMELNDLIK